MKLSDFDYHLPSQLIAQHPASRRDLSRLLVLDRKDETIRHHRFCDLIQFLRKGDLVILNDTKVIPARLMGRRSTGGKVEILLLEQKDSGEYRALIKPLGRLKEGEEIFLKRKFSCRLKDARNKIVVFENNDAPGIMKKVGLLPLPPYIRRKSDASDRRRYQTVFAQKEGAVAAPTAGLHFTRRLLSNLKKKGVNIATLTLHVNYATFSPVRSEDIRDHHMREEYYRVPKATVELIRRTKEAGGRIVAVGTTVCKSLEDSADFLLGDQRTKEISKASSLFIYPPYSFKIVDSLVTNFHLPRTSLLMLVSAFAGADLIKRAYGEAVQCDYRFYSYGDAMLIL